MTTTTPARRPLLAILTLAGKDLTVLFRDRFALFWIFAFPLVYALFFGVLFQDSGGGARSPLYVALVDEARSEVSGQLIERLAGHASLRVDRASAEPGAAPLLVALADARELVAKGRRAAYVRVVGEDAGGNLEIGIDPARKAEAGFLQGILMEAIFGAAPSARQSLVRMTDVTRSRAGRPRSSFEITLPSALVWGLMSIAMGFAITIVRERTQGTLLRLAVAPISRAQILAGKACGCFAMCMIVMLGLLVFGSLALGVRLGNPLLLLGSMAATATCFTGLMMTVAVLGKTEAAVAGASWGVMMPFAMIGGGMIPLIAMPPWLLTVSHASPFKWAIYALEGAIWRGFSLADMGLPWGILVAIGVVFFAIGARLFRGAVA